jgi:asparagine N-glycosylation enzyme membrane subunit Stt3
MAILLVSLLLIYMRLRKANAAETSSGMRWFVQLPFSVYLGWITVATIANATDVLDFNNWNGFGIAGETWAIIMLAVAVLIAIWMMVAQRDAPYLAVLAWAFAGIGVKFAGASIVSTAAYAAAIIAGILLVAALLLRVKEKRPLI